MLRTNFVLTCIIALGAQGTLSPGPAHAAGKATLAGKRYEVELIQEGKQEKMKDTLVFGKKDFEALACRKWGFKPSKYKSGGTSDSIRFEAVSRSRKEGVNKWTGYVKGQGIHAELVWEKKGQPTYKYIGEGMEMAAELPAAPPVVPRPSGASVTPEK